MNAKQALVKHRALIPRDEKGRNRIDALLPLVNTAATMNNDQIAAVMAVIDAETEEIDRWALAMFINSCVSEEGGSEPL